jgi:hypothetical protein
VGAGTGGGDLVTQAFKIRGDKHDSVSVYGVMDGGCGETIYAGVRVFGGPNAVLHPVREFYRPRE